MKLPAQLGITMLEFAALLATRELLKSKTVRHNPTPTNERHFDSVNCDLPLIFNMAISARKADCGTVGCIGGHMAMIMGIADSCKVTDYVLEGRSHDLRPLFYPSDKYGEMTTNAWRKITKTQAVKAIDNFLAGKGPRWASVLKK